MCKSIKPEPTVDEHLAFRWWTYGALILYTASLLVLLGTVLILFYIRRLLLPLPRKAASASSTKTCLQNPRRPM